MFEELMNGMGQMEEVDPSTQNYIIQKQPNESGGYGPLQTWNYDTIPDTVWYCPGKFFKTFYPEGKRMAGFVTYEVDEETKTVISMEWNEDAYQKEVAKLPDPVVQAKSNKKSELASICAGNINNGADVQLTDGTTRHFTYDINDQANVTEMFMAVSGGATEYPYHAQGETCEMYSAKDIILIYSALSMLKTNQITYQNQLKQYVDTLTTEEEVNAVEYGQELTGTYLEEYNTLMAQAKTQMENVLSRFSGEGSQYGN